MISSIHQMVERMGEAHLLGTDIIRISGCCFETKGATRVANHSSASADASELEPSDFNFKRSEYMRRQLTIASLAALALMQQVPSSAALDEDASCADLFRYRNYFYHGAGYCFKTRRAIAEWGNAGCIYDKIEDVPLSAETREEIGEIARVERRKGCRP